MAKPVRLLVCLVITFLSCYKDSAAAYWAIKTTPIVLGGNVELTCNTSRICNGCSKRWHRGSDSQLLTYDGAPTNPLKYTSSFVEDGYNLVIKNFTMEDAKEEYICTHGFQSFKKKFIHDDNFAYYRFSSTLNVSSTLDVNLIFKEVYPTPDCYIFLNNQNLTNRLKRNTRIETMFYHATFRLNTTLINKTCGNVLHMYCHIGSINLDVVKQNLEHGQCNGTFTDTTISKTSKVTTILIAIGSFGIVMAVAAFVIRYKRRKKRSRKYTHRNEKEENIPEATELIELKKEKQSVVLTNISEHKHHNFNKKP